MIPVLNPTETPALISSNGHVWVIPPAKSNAYWRVEMIPNAPVGSPPHRAVSYPNSLAGTVRGPIVSVPDHVIKDRLLGKNATEGGGHALIFGAAALARENSAKEEVRQAVADAREELARLRAQLEQERAEVGRRIEAEVRAEKERSKKG